MNDFCENMHLITEVEAFVANFLSDVFATPLKAMCVNSEQKWPETKDSFFFDLEGKEIALTFKTLETPFPHDWLLARFANLLYKSANKYQGLKLKESLENSNPVKAIECAVYGSDSAQALCCVLIYYSEFDICKDFASYNYHPLEDNLFANIKLKSFIPCDVNSLSLESLKPGSQQIVHLEAGGKTFFTKAEFNQKSVKLRILEEEMEEEVNELDTEACYLEILLGNIKISLKDFLSLRPGNIIKFDMEDRVEVKLCFSGQPWGKGILSFQNEELGLEITEIGSLLTEKKQLSFENPDYLVRD